MLGGDLRCTSFAAFCTSGWLIRSKVHLERKGHIGEEVVRFWMAELSGALEYLHRQRIIHRYVYLAMLWSPNADYMTGT